MDQVVFGRPGAGGSCEGLRIAQALLALQREGRPCLGLLGQRSCAEGWPVRRPPADDRAAAQQRLRALRGLLSADGGRPGPG